MLNRSGRRGTDVEHARKSGEKTGHQRVASLRFVLLGVGLAIGSFHLAGDGMLRGAERSSTAIGQGTGANTSIRILRGDGNPVVDGVVIVKFKDALLMPRGLSKTGISSLDILLGEQGVVAIEQAFPLPARLLGDKGRALQRIYYVRYESGSHPRQVALRISRDPNVEYAVPRYVHRIYDSPEPRPTSAGSLVTPDDALYPLMSHLVRVQAPGAWGVVKGEAGGVIIAVVDGGTDWQHEDLLANIWTNSGEIPDNNIDDDNNGYIDDVRGWNFVNRDGDPAGLPGTPLNTSHGTGVAGVASAVTNNAIGIAGASWNAQLLPVNASCSSDSLICFGVEGIIYAAVNGADIISLSWGSAHPDLTSFEERALRQFWRTVSDFAGERGALLVAAAGNDNVSNDDVLHMPASAEHILAVGATNKSDDRKAGFSNYGVTVDVFAPGAALNTTTPGNGYTELAFGTSFSTPLVVGIAALAKTQFPDFTPEQLAQQMRVTADPIDNVNSARTGLMGKGRINALRAVTATSTPAIRIAGISFTESGGDGFIENGETVDVTVSLVNYLADAANITVTLTQADPNITITSGEAFISSLISGGTDDVTFQFTLDQAELGQPLPFVVEVSAGSYQDRDLFKLYANEPYVVTHNTGTIRVSLTTEGNIGWIGFADESPGVGFVYNGTNLLFEGGLLVGISKNKVSDSIRGEAGALERDFQLPLGAQLVLGPGQIANEEGAVVLIDDLAASPIGLSIRQESYADNNPDFDDFVIFKYTITNQSGGPLWNLYAGLFFDWDLSENGQTDYGRFDSARRMGVVQNSASVPSLLAATRMLTANGDLSYHTIHNLNEIYYDPSQGWDGFTPDEKWRFLSGGIQTQTVDNTDVSTIMAAGPFAMQPDQSIEVAFAVIGANILEDLDSHADSAQAFWDRAIAPPQANHAPVFTSVLPITLIFAGEIFTYTYAAEDVDGDDLTFTLIEGPPNAAIDGKSGVFTFQAANDQLGSHKITVFVSDSSSSAVNHSNVIVEEAVYSLNQNYSNPFTLSSTTPTTTIIYQLAKESKVELVVYDLLGREVRKLVNDNKSSGRYTVTWDARDNFGRPVSTGIYLYRIRAGDFMEIRKMTLLK